ncbi:MAG: hypothetical protein WA857_20650 [Candidatus Acidiferrum sp.]
MTLRRRLIRILVILLLLPPLLAGVAGWLVRPEHPNGSWVLLICDEKDEALPCRHTREIYAAAIGPKQLWEVPGAFHTAAIGFEPAEFARRVLGFFANVAQSQPVQ